MAIPEKIFIFRITHIDNLDHILENGLYTASSIYANPNYINIGDITLIESRRMILAPDPPGGTLEDYIPFYLGPRSPMLLQIATGYDGVKRYSQDEIIYIVSSFEMIKSHRLPYFFTDGHARSLTSNKYSSEKDFAKLDWKTIYTQYWQSDENDLLRKQKKQAELLIKEFMPVSCIEFIGVRNNNVEENVLTLLLNHELEIPVKMSPESLYYDNIP